jgi:hypothetical protein
MAKRYHDTRTSKMTSEFSSSSRDEMVSSTDGLFPEKVVMKDFPASSYGSKHEPYDGIRGIDDQIDSDSRILQKRNTKGSF